ncbi:MAG TPA: arginyltransferase [Pirellulaceae bacterium]|nr:arginyltransferase [Pirellulaceae bacterium]
MPIQGLEITVLDQPEACPYLPGRTARLPLRMPLERLSPELFDRRLEEGDRRSGGFLYKTACPACQACEPIRLDIAQFTPNSSQLRAWKRGRKLFHLQVQQPLVDETRITLFNKHRRERHLAHDRDDIDAVGYEQFLVSSCCETLELSYYLDDALAMVAILDRGRSSASAVYTYYDPELTKLSPGVYSVMQEIELCRQWNLRYLYLGFYVAGSPHMVYKATYRPHERRVHDQWQHFV